MTREMRARAKTINFGVIYGMGDSALAKQTGVTRAEGARFIEDVLPRSGTAASPSSGMEQTIEAARRGEAVRTLLGRRRFLPNLHSANRGLRMEAERVAKNTPIQGTAADILKVAMVNLGAGDVVPGARMILTVHDELVFEVPEGRVEEASNRDPRGDERRGEARRAAAGRRGERGELERRARANHAEAPGWLKR